MLLEACDPQCPPERRETRPARASAAAAPASTTHCVVWARGKGRPCRHTTLRLGRDCRNRGTVLAAVAPRPRSAPCASPQGTPLPHLAWWCRRAAPAAAPPENAVAGCACAGGVTQPPAAGGAAAAGRVEMLGSSGGLLNGAAAGGGCCAAAEPKCCTGGEVGVATRCDGLGLPMSFTGTGSAMKPPEGGATRTGAGAPGSEKT